MEQEQTLRCLLEGQLRRYPAARAADLLKLLYQNEFGCRHLMEDPARSLEYLREESAGLSPEAKAGEPPAEPIGNGLCRLHLRPLLRGTLRLETLFRLLERTASRPRGSREGFLQKAALLERLCREGALPLPTREVQEALRAWEAGGCRPFRHSPAFRERHAPAYRVIEERFCNSLPLLSGIDGLLSCRPRVRVAVDGRCAAGKTTLAAMLFEVYGCDVIPMDHFFLRPEQRTEERLREPGGNVDYERFALEVLKPLRAGVPFSYRPYDCAADAFREPVAVEQRPLCVVEGSYSLHPRLKDAYDLRVFLSIRPEEQLRRIRARNGERMMKRFEREWIPLEEGYFRAFSIAEGADLRFEDGVLVP